MKRADIIIIVAILILAIGGYVITGSLKEYGAFVSVSVDGHEVKRLSLYEDIEYEIEGIGGYNLLVIDDKRAYLSDADCPDKLCVKSGSISRSGESIICLPHKGVVEVYGGSDSDVDIMVK